MKKRTKRILIGLTIFILLIVVVLPLAIGLFFPEEKLRAIVLPRATEALGRQVDCSRIGLHFGLHGFELELTDLSLGADPGEFGMREISLPRLTTRLAWRPLLRREIQIEALHFEQPRILLALAPADTTARDVATGGEAALMAIAAPNVTLSNGVVQVVDRKGLNLKVGIEQGRFSTAVAPTGAMELTAELELNIEQSLPDLICRIDGIDIELAGGLADEIITITSFALQLDPLLLAVEQGGEVFNLGGDDLGIACSGRAPLAAFEATPPDLDAITCALQLTGRNLKFTHQGCPDNVLVEELTCNLGLQPGQGGEVRVGNILIRRPVIDVTLPAAAMDSTAGEPPAAAPMVALALSAPEVAVREGRLTLRQVDGPTVVVELPALDLGSTLNTAGEIGFTAKGRGLPLSIEQDNLCDGDLKASLDLAGQLTGEAVTLTTCRLDITDMRLDVWPPTGGDKMHLDWPQLSVGVNGVAPLDAFAGEKPDLGALNCTVAVTARDAVLQSPLLPEPLELTALRLLANPGIVKIDTLRIASTNSSAALSGEIWDLQKNPRMKLALVSPRVDLADFIMPPAERPVATGTGTGAAPESKPVLPPLLLPGTMEVSIGHLQHGLISADNVRGQVAVSRSDVRFRKLEADMYDGSVTGSLRLSPTAEGDARCVGDFHVLGVRAPAFLAAFTPVKRGIDGTLNTDIDVGLILLSAEHAAAAPRPFRNLEVGSHVNLVQGALLGSTALHSLCGLAGLPQKDRYGLDDLNLTLIVKNDRVNSRNLTFPLEGGRIKASGSTGLDGSLDYRGSWELGPQIMERLGSGSPLYWLRDDSGKVEIDFIVGGDLKNPNITLDQSALEAKAKDELKEEGQKLLDKGLDALKKRFR